MIAPIRFKKIKCRTLKEMKGRPKQRWMDNIRDGKKDYPVTEDMAQKQSVWNIKTTNGPLLHR